MEALKVRIEEAIAAYDFEEGQKYTEEEMKEAFDKCFEQFNLDEEEDWWPFSADQLTSCNFTELLEANAEFCDENDSPMPRSQDELLKNYGCWEANKSREFYFEVFCDIHADFMQDDEDDEDEDD